MINKKANLLLLGLDDSGKTVFMYRLKDDINGSMYPTQYPHSEEFILDKINVKVWDVAGKRH